MIIYKYKGQSLLKYCQEHKIPYGLTRKKIVEGMSIEEALSYAQENKGIKSRSKTTINGVGLITYLETNYKQPVRAFMAYTRLKFLGYSLEEILENIERFR
jgi:hypothetical protein